MTTTSVSSGVVSNGLAISSGDELIVSSGGSATSTTVDDGGSLVLDGGYASATTVTDGGSAVLIGGEADDSTVVGGGVQVLSAGGSAVGVTVSDGGSEVVFSGGVAGYAVLGSGGSQTISSDGYAVSTTVLSGGTEFVSWLGTTDHTTVSAGGTEVIDGEGGDAFYTTLSSGGTMILYDGGFAEYTAVSAGGTEVASSGITFDGSEATLVIHGTTLPTTILGGLTSGGIIDLADVAYASTGSVSLDANDVLTVTEGAQGYTLQLAGDFSYASFQMISDTNGGTEILVNPCYREGTRLLTERGEVAIEDLVLGDHLITVSGEARPVTWIGHRRVNCRAHPEPQKVLPVRVLAHAFGQGRPVRDLFLSPDHAVFVENVLIPIRLLENGTTVQQVEVADVTYYHVELARHDVVLAEGLPAETYLDTGNRDAFANGGGVMQLHPDFGPRNDHSYLMWESFGYAPLVVVGDEVDRVRASVRMQARMLGFADNSATQASNGRVAA
jgi:autotransporter passenger strand-loop-strand repeat protein